MLTRIGKLFTVGLLLSLVMLALLVLALAAPVTAQDGAQIYEENCERCHAEDGKGVRDANFTDPSFWRSTTKRGLENSVKNGVQIMPAYENKLTDEEIEAVLEYTSNFAGVSYSEIPRFIPVISGFTVVVCLVGSLITAILFRR
ncbi:MAG: cytochrome c [Archaeoglobaceae archaeon]